MTALNYQEAQLMAGFPSNMVPSPQGWVTTGIHVINLNAEKVKSDEALSTYDANLTKAAKRTEQLIDALNEGLSVEVSVSYMRVEKDTMFHFLLLISEDDFHSPKIVAARLLAEKFAKTEGYDIRFAFAIESENRMSHTMRFGGYKLMFKGAPKCKMETH